MIEHYVGLDDPVSGGSHAQGILGIHVIDEKLVFKWAEFLVGLAFHQRAGGHKHERLSVRSSRKRPDRAKLPITIDGTHDAYFRWVARLHIGRNQSVDVAIPDAAVLIERYDPIAAQRDRSLHAEIQRRGNSKVLAIADDRASTPLLQFVDDGLRVGVGSVINDNNMADLSRQDLNIPQKLSRRMIGNDNRADQETSPMSAPS